MDEVNMPDDIQKSSEDETVEEEEEIKAPPPGSKKENKKSGKPLSFWIALVVSLLLVLSTGINIILVILFAAQMTGQGEPAILRNESFIDGDKNSRNKILLIPVEGAIMDLDENSSFYKKSIGQYIKEELKNASQDSNVKGIIFQINSPGGGINECDNIYREILKFKKEKPDVPIVVSMKQVAASGGYYISAPAKKIFAEPTTITGSIGVIMQFTNMAELFGKLGLKSMTFKSGKMKDIGSATREMTKEEKEVLDNIIKEMSSKFIQIVKDNRKLSDEKAKIFSDGRIFTGQQAAKIGLVDEIGYLEDAFKAAKDLANIKDAKLVKARKQDSFFNLFEEAVKDINPQSKVNEEFQKVFTSTPKLMYMWNIY